MLEHTKKPLTSTLSLSFDVPLALVDKVREFMRSEGIEEDKEYYTVKELFPFVEREEQSAYLRGVRHRENLSQKQLAELAGIPTRHISEMESNKRPIGKKNAHKLAQALNCNARSFITM